MSKQRSYPCWSCGARAEVVRVIPRRIDDGRIRCRDCWRERRREIREHWRAAKTAYDPTQNRGGMQLVETETSESNAA